jgi:hypothetical protein
MIPGNTSSQGKYVDPPTSVSATAGNGQATVSFTLPVYDGKGVATFVATSSPGGFTASGASSPITVTGLSNGTAYTFTVTTISGYGVSAVSSASNSVSPVAPTTAAPPPPPPTTAAPTTVNPCAGSPAYFTLIGYNCVGYTYQTVRSDGCNGQFANAPESVANSPLCGYVAPTSPPATTTTTTAAPCTAGGYNSGLKCPGYEKLGNCYQRWYRNSNCSTYFLYCEGPGC